MLDLSCSYKLLKDGTGEFKSNIKNPSQASLVSYSLPQPYGHGCGQHDPNQKQLMGSNPYNACSKIAQCKPEPLIGMDKGLVIHFASCSDNQRSESLVVPKTGIACGAMTLAFTKSVKQALASGKQGTNSYNEVLKVMMMQLRAVAKVQTPQISSSHEFSLDDPLNM